MREVFIHAQALCESSKIGPGTRIWAFAHILPGATVGADCNICDGVFIENEAVVGDRVTVKCGVQLWDGIELEDDVFVGPNATFTNDRYPRSRQWLEEHPKTVVRNGASIGANATILPGLEIGQGAFVGAGAVVTDTVPPHAIVVGNPARITGYVQTSSASSPTLPVVSSGGLPDQAELSDRVALGVSGTYVQRFSEFSDLRGSLTAGEFPTEAIPFAPKRWFLVYGVPSRQIRGEHAHRICHQFLVCVSGQVTVAVDDGYNRNEVRLDSPTIGVYIPPLIWGSQFRYEADAVLLVFASHPYESSDYIRNYDSFLREAELGRANGSGTPT
jgi:UDP-2-acetamido-3-amino-2,3-dideoxy-glucuronate N-acetyltransferase